MSTLAQELREDIDAFKQSVEKRVSKMEESQRVQAEVAALFVKRDKESQDKQRVIRIALGLE